MQISQLRQRLSDAGARDCHADRIFRAWSQHTSLDNRRSPADQFLPLAVRHALPEWQAQVEALARIHERHDDADTAIRLLVALQDKQIVESVLLPRDGLCVSTQVGCAVGCVFCMTGKSGLLRQLGSAEIVAQVVQARRIRPVRRVVFMGMGEPSHNLDNVLEAIEFLGTLGAIGHKNLVFSTVGDRRVFERLPLGTVKPALAISLHTTHAALRRQLLPKAAELSPEELVDAAEIYARSTAYPIQYQWTLMDGINDSPEEMDGIIRLLKGKYAMMNLIPYNRIDGEHFRRPSREKAVALSDQLNRAGILTKLRNSAGQEIDGACGQLRARSQPKARPA